MTVRLVMSLAVLALATAGCGEKAQTAAASKKVDAKPWQAAAGPYSAADWKGGDQAAWEAQMRLRAQGQNEYSRSAAPVPVASASVAPAKAP